jgi:phage terminase small subunit
MDNTTELNERQKIFCSEYIYDWNASRAYSIAFPLPVKTNDTIRANASQLLTNPNIQAFIKEIQSDLEKQSGISRLMVLNEHKKLAFSSIAHLHNKWIELKEFETLTDSQKDCISEIDTKVLKKNIGTNQEPEIVDVEYIKIKLYDKQKSLDAISKMLGFNEADKVELKNTIEYCNVSKQFPDK